MTGLRVRSDGSSVTFDVRVAPRARREGVVGVHDGALKVSLTAPPVDGAANAALVKLFAKVLGVPKHRVSLVRGGASRQKSVRVEGLTPEALHEALRAHLE